MAAVTGQGDAVFWRFRHSISSCRQFSSPSPVTKTSSQLSAFCAREAVSLAAEDSPAEAVPVVVEPAAAPVAPDRLVASPLRSEVRRTRSRRS